MHTSAYTRPREPTVCSDMCVACVGMCPGSLVTDTPPKCNSGVKCGIKKTNFSLQQSKWQLATDTGMGVPP